jgi:hypothetical protein
MKLVQSYPENLGPLEDIVFQIIQDLLEKTKYFERYYL